MKIAKAKGICLNYGPCEYHSNVITGACKDCDGIKVPVYVQNSIIGDFCHYHPDGYAKLKDTKDGVIAEVKITNDLIVSIIEELNKSNDSNDLKFGCMVNHLKKSENGDIVHGMIRYVDVTYRGLGDKAVFDILEE